MDFLYIRSECVDVCFFFRRIKNITKDLKLEILCFFFFKDIC